MYCLREGTGKEGQAYNTHEDSHSEFVVSNDDSGENSFANNTLMTFSRVKNLISVKFAIKHLPGGTN